MPAKREDTTSPRDSDATTSPSSAAASSASPSPGARARAGCRSSCSTAASSAPGPRASPPGCSRRSPRPTPASAPLLELGLRSAQRWPAFAAELGEVSGVDVGYRARAARSCSPATATRPRRSSASARCASASGCASSALLPSAARRARARARARRCAARSTCPTTTRSTRAACARRSRAPRERAGAVLRPGVEVDDLAALPAEQVVVAAGPWSGAFGDEARVRPVKGQSLRLRDPPGPGLLERVVRWGQPSPGYLVPRGDGRYVLGATLEERGFDTAVTAGGAARAAARRRASSCPASLELEVEEHARRPAPRHARQRAAHRPLAARPARRVGHRATTATASCWRPSPPSSSSPSWPASRSSTPSAPSASRGRAPRGGDSRDRPQRRAARARRRDDRRAAGRPRRRGSAPAVSPSPSTARSSRGREWPSHRVDDGRPRRGAVRDAGRLTVSTDADPDHRHARSRSPGARCARA